MSQRCCKSLVEETHLILIRDVAKLTTVAIVEIVANALIVVTVVMVNYRCGQQNALLPANY